MEMSKQTAVGSKQKTSRGYKDLKVYQMSYRLAMRVFIISKEFPKEERYSLIDQIRRSSRSIVVNLGEAFRKRKYPAMWVNKLTDCDAECTETMIWIDFAKDCQYIDQILYNELTQGYGEIGKMLSGMMLHPEKFTP